MRYSTHLFALLCFLLGVVSSLDDNLKDIEEHINILKGNVSPPTRSPDEEAKLEGILKKALNSIVETPNVNKENVDRANELVQLMMKESLKQKEQINNDFNDYKAHWREASRPPSLYDMSPKSRKPSPTPKPKPVETIDNSITTKSTSEEPITQKSYVKAGDGEKTTQEETRPTEATLEATNGSIIVEGNPTRNGKDLTSRNGKNSREFLEEKDALGAHRTHQETTTEYFKVETTPEETTTQLADESEGNTTETTTTENSHGITTNGAKITKKGGSLVKPFGPGMSGPDSRKKRSLAKRVLKRSTKKPSKSSGFKFLEKVEGAEKDKKVAKYRFAPKSVWFDLNSGVDSRKIGLNGKGARNVLNPQKLKKTSDRIGLEKVVVKGSGKSPDDRQANFIRQRQQGIRFGPGMSGADSRKKRFHNNGVFGKKVGGQGPGLGKLLSDATGDKRIFD